MSAWLARCARFFARLTGLFVALLLALAAWSQEGKVGDKIRVRFADHHEETVEVVSWDTKGIKLKLEKIDKPVPFVWGDFEPRTASDLRARYLGAPKETEAAPMSQPGLRVKTKDGRTYEGVVLPNSPPTELWLKNREGSFYVKLADIVSREDARFKLNELYTEKEVFDILTDRLHPHSAEDWDKVAEELVRAKCPDRALTAIKLADVLRRTELPEGRLYKDLIRLRDEIQDITLKQAVFNIQEGFLAGQYEGALAQVDKIEKSLKSPENDALVPGLRRVRTELQQLRDMSRDEQIILEWYRLFDSLLRAKAFDHTLSYAPAADYAQNKLAAEVQKYVSERFNIGKNDDSAKVIFERRSPATLFKHDYDESSWLAERPEAGAAETWWTNANDAQRFTVLKGLAIEKHLKVVAAEHKSCHTCGGKGTVDRAKFPESVGGVCPTCLGLKQLRVLFYR